MRCPACGQYEMVKIDTLCGLRFRVCSNCDYGINEHTEEVCDCA